MSMKNECAASQEYMMKYFDGILNDIEHGHLKQHLKSCPCCAEEFAGLKETLDYVENHMEMEPPADFEKKVMERVRTEIEAARQKANQLVIYIYAGVTLLLSIIAVIMGMVVQEINLLEVLTGLNSTGEAVERFQQLIAYSREGYKLMEAIFLAVTQVPVILLKTYYPYIIILAGTAITVPLLRTEHSGKMREV